MTGFNLSIAEHIPEPIFVFDTKESIGKNNNMPTISWVNAAAELWIGRSSKAIIGKTLLDISSSFNDLALNLSNCTQNQGSVRGHELTVLLADGRTFICSYLVFSCPIGLALMIKPEQAGWNKNLKPQQSGAVTMLGRMLAHELKNPLAGIRGAAQLLESELVEPDNLELTGLIKHEVDRIGRLVEQIELFGSENSTQFAKLNIHTILRNAKLLLQSQNSEGPTKQKFKIIENYDPSLPDVFGDKDGLMQVVVNLVANAVEAIQDNTDMQNPGTIELQTLYRTGINKRMVDGTRRSLPVEVRIIDNGPGIDENIRERVFQPFVTGKNNGHGLGLALVSKIVAEHGGLIDVQSKPGKTSFSILLPIAPLVQNLREGLH